MPEPVTVETARARLGLASNFRDAEIGDLITAARAHVEDLSGVTCTRRAVAEQIPAWGGVSPLYPRTNPIRAFTSVAYVDTDGVAVPALAGVRMVGPAAAPYLLPADGEVWPVGGGIVATFDAGFDNEEGEGKTWCPDQLVQAILILVRTWFDTPDAPVPAQVASLCRPFRKWLT